MAEKVLMNEYKALSKETWTNISLVNDNVFEWSVALIVLNPDSLYYGGYFKAIMKFPTNYPYEPPDFRFVRPLWHPNIYPDGRLCISILHQPGEDIMSGESAGERWSPVQRVESVLISVLSLLDDAEVSSPANIDAGVQLRKEPEAYKERVAQDREKSKEDIPEDFVMPTHESAFKKEEKVEEVTLWEAVQVTAVWNETTGSGCGQISERGAPSNLKRDSTLRLCELEDSRLRRQKERNKEEKVVMSVGASHTTHRQ